MAEMSGMRRGTGREKDEWFRVLDDWGAVGRPYREIADWLTGEHGLSKWWAQKIIVEYEQARGVRPPGVRRDGSFEVTASKTVAVPVGRLYEAFVDPKARERWLPGAEMHERSSKPRRAARFDWEDGSSRVSVEFTDQGRSKSSVGVAHRKLTDHENAKRMKAMWKERLADLKSYLEA